MIQNVNKCSTSSSVIVINDKSKSRISKFLIYDLTLWACYMAAIGLVSHYLGHIPELSFDIPTSMSISCYDLDALLSNGVAWAH